MAAERKIMNLFKKACFLACATLAFYASAGDRLVGIISAIDATKSNCASNPDGGPNSWDGGIYQPFPITAGAMLTLQYDTSVFVGTDLQSVTAVNGIQVDPNTIFLTSVGGQNSATITTVGPGTMKSACVSILPQAVDGGFKGCKVFERNGKE